MTEPDRAGQGWEQVWQGESEAVANIVAGRLEAEGIAVRIEGNSTPYRSDAFVMGGTWGIVVPVEQAAVARELLRANDEGHNVIEFEPGSALSSNQKATFRFIAVLVLGIAIFIAVAAVWGR